MKNSFEEQTRSKGSPRVKQRLKAIKDFQHFTEHEYRELLRIAREKWEFVSYESYRRSGRICLWRHDLDFSVHRAYRLAQIEAEERVSSTYFILLHSNFYNALEGEVFDLIVQILQLGHRIGLHFDPGFYKDRPQPIDELLTFERSVLETSFQTEVNAFSLHNPTVGDWLSYFKDENIGGMVNAYSNYIKDNFFYCSDSNGFWRFQSLRKVVEEEIEEKLHILTHAAWWTPQPMAPRERISRCIKGRAERCSTAYDLLLAQNNRENIK